MCAHTDSAPIPNAREAAAAAVTAAGGRGEAGDMAEGGQPRGSERRSKPGFKPQGKRHALPPMVAVLKVWAPNEATAALLLEGAELRLHR